MGKSRFKLVYSFDEEEGETRQEKIEAEIKRRLAEQKKQREQPPTKPCTQCSEEAMVYDGLVPVKGVKAYIWLLMFLFIAGVWAYAVWYFMQGSAQNSWILMIGLTITPIALTVGAILAVRLMRSPHQGIVVVCKQCNSAVPETEAPQFTTGWDLDKLRYEIDHPKPPKRNKLMKKLAASSGMTEEELLNKAYETVQQSKEQPSKE